MFRRLFTAVVIALLLLVQLGCAGVPTESEPIDSPPEELEEANPRALEEVPCEEAFPEEGPLAAVSLPWEIQVSIEIVIGAPEFELYSDEACTTPIVSPVYFGQRERGKPVVWDTWAKNVGVEPFDLTVIIVGDVTWGNVTMTPSTASLSAGDVVLMVLNIDIPADAVPGVRNFGIQFIDQ